MRPAPIGGERIPREVMESHQRERVLEHATKIFAKRGYQGTTVDDLLAAGKIGVGNFYSLFEGKEDCFLAAFERAVGGARSQISAAAAGGRGWGEETWLGLRALTGAMLADPLAARLVLVEAQSAGPEALARYNALLDEAIAWVAAARAGNPVAAGLPAGFERSAVAGLAFYLQQCLLGSARPEPEALFGEAAEALLGPLLGAEELRRLGGSLAAASA
jgi:AcrR family transcriptional regulator